MLSTTKFLLTGAAAVLLLPGTVHGLFHYGRVDCPTTQFCIPPDCVPGQHDIFEVILPIGQGCDAALGPGVVAQTNPGAAQIVGSICGVQITITPGVSFTASNGESGQCFSYGGSNTISHCGDNCIFADGGWCNSGICG